MAHNAHLFDHTLLRLRLAHIHLVFFGGVHRKNFSMGVCLHHLFSTGTNWFGPVILVQWGGEGVFTNYNWHTGSSGSMVVFLIICFQLTHIHLVRTIRLHGGVPSPFLNGKHWFGTGNPVPWGCAFSISIQLAHIDLVRITRFHGGVPLPFSNGTH